MLRTILPLLLLFEFAGLGLSFSTFTTTQVPHSATVDHDSSPSNTDNSSCSENAEMGEYIYVMPSLYHGSLKLPPLISRDKIDDKAGEIAAGLANRFDRPYFLVVLKGSFSFWAMLSFHMMKLSVGFDVSFVRAKSYDGMERGKLAIEGVKLEELEGRDVVIVEDIVDSGATLKGLVEALRVEGGGGLRELLIVTTLTKRNVPQIKTDVEILAGFCIDDEFVVGCGMDVNEYMRDLADLYVLNEKGIKKFTLVAHEINV